jgi:hypothetical protein
MEIKNHMPLIFIGEGWNTAISVADIVGAFGLSLRSISIPHYFVSFYDPPDIGEEQIPFLQSQHIINRIILASAYFIQLRSGIPHWIFETCFTSTKLIE